MKLKEILGDYVDNLQAAAFGNFSVNFRGNAFYFKLLGKGKLVCQRWHKILECESLADNFKNIALIFEQTQFASNISNDGYRSRS